MSTKCLPRNDEFQSKRSLIVRLSIVSTSSPTITPSRNQALKSRNLLRLLQHRLTRVQNKDLPSHKRRQAALIWLIIMLLSLSNGWITSMITTELAKSSVKVLTVRSMLQYPKNMASSALLKVSKKIKVSIMPRDFSNWCSLRWRSLRASSIPFCSEPTKFSRTRTISTLSQNLQKKVTFSNISPLCKNPDKSHLTRTPSNS